MQRGQCCRCSTGIGHCIIGSHMGNTIQTCTDDDDEDNNIIYYIIIVDKDAHTVVRCAYIIMTAVLWETRRAFRGLGTSKDLKSDIILLSI